MNKILDYIKGVLERATDWVSSQVPKVPVPVPVPVRVKSPRR